MAEEEEVDWASATAPPRRRRRRTNEDRAERGELTPEEKDEAARWLARFAAVDLLIGWLVVIAVNAAVFLAAFGAYRKPPANPKDMMAWNELGEFLLWASSLALAAGLFGVVSAVRLYRIRGHAMGLASALLLFVFSLPVTMVCPMVWLVPVSVLVILGKKRVGRVFRLAREGRRANPNL